MDSTKKNQWQVRIAAAIIFVLGFTAGILALNVYRGFVRGAPRSFDAIAERLQLSDDQKPKVQQIFSDTREQLRALRKEAEPKMDEIRRQADERLRQVLNEQQWKQFQTMRDDLRRRRAGPAGDGR